MCLYIEDTSSDLGKRIVCGHMRSLHIREVCASFEPYLASQDLKKSNKFNAFFFLERLLIACISAYVSIRQHTSVPPSAYACISMHF